MPSLSDFGKRWEAWGVPAAIGVLAPWYEKVLAFSLISNYWNPELNILCTVVGAITAVIAFAVFLRQSKMALKRRLFRMLVLLVTALVACLVLTLSVGVTYFPDAQYQWVVWTCWILAYVAIFVCLSTTIVLAMLLLPSPPKKTQP